MHTPANSFNSKRDSHKRHDYHLFVEPGIEQADKQKSTQDCRSNPLGITFDHASQLDADISQYFLNQQEDNTHGQPRPDQSMPVPVGGKPTGLIHVDGQQEPGHPHPQALSPPLSPQTLEAAATMIPHAAGASAPAFHGRSSSLRNVMRRKSRLRRSHSLATSPAVAASSWDHIQSPAASFLAQFAAPQPNEDILEEQEGDEIDDYAIEDIIGYGGFGTVRRGYCISTGQRVAIKIIRKSLVTEGSEDQHRLERELAIWRSLCHENIVQVHTILDTDNATYIVCDYCQGGNLLERLNRLGTAMDEATARPLFKSIAKAVAYLHNTAKVCHKDLKLENILLDQAGNVKVCDFGLAIHQQPSANDTPVSPMGGSCSGSCSEMAGGSLAYASPEQIQSSQELACPKTDIWSLGVILYTMVVGRLPFSDQYDVRLRQKILNAEYELPTHLSPPLQSLIRGCLEINPKKRYTIDQVVASPWLSM